MLYAPVVLEKRISKEMMSYCVDCTYTTRRNVALFSVLQRVPEISEFIALKFVV